MVLRIYLILIVKFFFALVYENSFYSIVAYLTVLITPLYFVALIFSIEPAWGIKTMWTQRYIVTSHLSSLCLPENYKTGKFAERIESCAIKITIIDENFTYTYVEIGKISKTGQDSGPFRCGFWFLWFWNTSRKCKFAIVWFICFLMQR